MKTKIIKDVPIGVLLIVLAFWCVVGIFYLTSLTSTLTVLLVILLSILCHKFTMFGFDLMFGIEIKDSE